jgi:hypothetical protein
MSTISMSYPEALRARRVPVFGMILLLSGLVALAILLLVMAHGTGQAIVSPSAAVPVTVPVPTPASAGMQSIPMETPVPPTHETSGPTVLPVPAPSAPSPISH